MSCEKCGLEKTEDGHDGCLGTLIGVMNACCGHGKRSGYVQFLDGMTIQGEDADVALQILKRSSVGYVTDPKRKIEINGHRVKILKNKPWYESVYGKPND